VFCFTAFAASISFIDSSILQTAKHWGAKFTRKVVFENDNISYQDNEGMGFRKKNNCEKWMSLKRSGVVRDTIDTVVACGRSMPQDNIKRGTASNLCTPGEGKAAICPHAQTSQMFRNGQRE
jgi:hypothetical protein